MTTSLKNIALPVIIAGISILAGVILQNAAIAVAGIILGAGAGLITSKH